MPHPTAEPSAADSAPAQLVVISTETACDREPRHFTMDVSACRKFHLEFMPLTTSSEDCQTPRTSTAAPCVCSAANLPDPFARVVVALVGLVMAGKCMLRSVGRRFNFAGFQDGDIDPFTLLHPQPQSPGHESQACHRMQSDPNSSPEIYGDSNGCAGACLRLYKRCFVL